MNRLAVDDRRRVLSAGLEEVRRRTRLLLDPLTDDDLQRQHHQIMSPLVWDIGHVANFEELWLLRELDGRPPHDPQLDQVYNPFDNPRWTRADLDILQRREAFAYMDDVRREALALMERTELDPAWPLVRDGYVWAMVAQHEAQHQETMLQALDLRSDLLPYPPAHAAGGRLPSAPPGIDDAARVPILSGPFHLGTDDSAAAYDNERPSHWIDLPAFAIDRYPVTARRYAEFLTAGGYDDPRWWSDAGWAWRHEAGEVLPQGWLPDGEGGWLVQRFGHVRPLHPAEILQHVSYWEAEAFCRFAGGRLPSEAEWEKAARWDPATGRSRRFPWGDEAPTAERANLDHRGWGPAAAGAYPGGASPSGVEQMVGDVYEWTSSDFLAYPAFDVFPYPEYSAVFFGDEYKVLRGSSWATSSLVARATFRNWDYPQRRQIFAGVRVAYSVDDGERS